VVGDIPDFNRLLYQLPPVVLSGRSFTGSTSAPHWGQFSNSSSPHLVTQIHCVSYLMSLWPLLFPLLALAFIALAFLSYSQLEGTELFWEERFSAYPASSTLQSASAVRS